MNQTTLQGHWDELKGQVKEQWGKLTDDEIKEIGGRKDQLLAKVKQHYGIGKEKAEKEVDNFLKKIKPPFKNAENGVISDTIRKFGDKAHDISYDLADKSEEYLASGAEVTEQIQDKIHESFDGILGYVKKHPMHAALGAAGIGFLLAKLLK